VKSWFEQIVDFLDRVCNNKHFLIGVVCVLLVVGIGGTIHHVLLKTEVGGVILTFIAEHVKAILSFKVVHERAIHILPFTTATMSNRLNTEK
jgi:hypothetical protein